MKHNNRFGNLTNKNFNIMRIYVEKMFIKFNLARFFVHELKPCKVVASAKTNNKLVALNQSPDK